MPKYIALIYGDERFWRDASADWTAENYEAHSRFATGAGDAVVGGAELDWTSSAVTIRAGEDGTQKTTDGPFVETKEALGGYYVLEAADIDAAVALAREIPEAKLARNGVEVRPLRSG